MNEGEKPMEPNEAKPPVDGATTERVDDTAATADDALRGMVERLQRLQAEFENYKKRMAREAARIEERTADRVIGDIIGLYDNVERAFESYADDHNVASFVAGVEQIFGQFSQLLEKLGVTRIPAIGETFDPAIHEALLCVPSKMRENAILEEFLPGYTRDGRVLRPSKVSVSQGPGSMEEEDQ